MSASDFTERVLRFKVSRRQYGMTWTSFLFLKWQRLAQEKNKRIQQIKSCLRGKISKLTHSPDSLNRFGPTEVQFYDVLLIHAKKYQMMTQLFQ